MVLGLIVIIMIGNKFYSRKVISSYGCDYPAEGFCCGITTPFIHSNVAVLTDQRLWCENQGLTCTQTIGQFTCTSGGGEGTCTDTDGGLDYSVKGHVLDPNNLEDVWDYCAGNTLREFYCDENPDSQHLDYDCASEGKVCTDGACVAPSGQDWCIDSDSNTYPTDNKQVKGTVTWHRAIGTQGTSTDSCYNGQVDEAMCTVSATSWEWMRYLRACDAGQTCQDGACKSEVCSVESDWDYSPCGAYTLGEWTAFKTKWLGFTKSNILFAQVANTYFGG